MVVGITISILSFSFAASAVYCLNDIRDVEADRIHPKKCRRPLASGDVSVPAAVVTMVIMAVLAVVIGFVGLGHQGIPAGSVVAAYLLLNIMYCLKLKQFAVIDVFIIAIGFVLRLVAGGFACDIWLSPWIVCLIFLLALFLAFSDRFILEAAGHSEML